MQKSELENRIKELEGIKKQTLSLIKTVETKRKGSRKGLLDMQGERAAQLFDQNEYKLRRSYQELAGVEQAISKVHLQKRQRHRKIVPISLLLAVVLCIGLFVIVSPDYGVDSITGAVVGILPETPATDCYETTVCVNETVESCADVTSKRCTSGCFNETVNNCSEQCLPTCQQEEINGKMREVCGKTCTEVCTDEVVENCDTEQCEDVVEEQCTSQIVEKCSTQTVCNDDSGNTGAISADTAEVGILPVEEMPIEEVVESPELTVLPVEEPSKESPKEEELEEINPEDPADGGLEVQPEVQPVENNQETGELEVPFLGENTTGSEEASVETNTSEPIPEQPSETPLQASGFSTLGLPTYNGFVLNTTRPLYNNSDYDNLTFYNLSPSDTDGDSVKSIINWFVNGTAGTSGVALKSLTVLNTPFEGVNLTTTDNGWDYSGYQKNFTTNATNIWEATGGYDGKGAYNFTSTIGNNMSIRNFVAFPTTQISVAFWIKTTGDGDGMFSYAPSQAENNEFLIFDQNPINVYTNNALDNTGVVVNDGNWHHLVVTWRSSDGLLEAYKDGVVEFSSAVGSLVPLNGSTGVNNCLVLGQDQDTVCGGYAAGQAFDGYLDELLIFNRTLTAEQVRLLYRNRTEIIANTETQAGETWAVYVTPNDGTADGKNFRSNNVTILGNWPLHDPPHLNTTNITINSTNTNLTVYNVSTRDPNNDLVKNIYNWNLDGKRVLDINIPFEGSDPSRFGPIGLRENTTDYAGFNNNASDIVTAKYFSDGGYDGRGAFNFSIACSRLNLDAVPNYGNSNYTVEAWFKTGTLGGGEKYPIVSFQVGRYFGLAGGDHLLVVSGDSAGEVNSTTGLTLNDSNWHHAAFVKEGNGTDQLKFYLDGEPVGSGRQDLSNNAGFEIGNDGFCGSHFNGWLDEIRLWNISLTAEQIRANYRNQTNTIVNTMTELYQNWSVDVTPNDGFENGDTLRSNFMTILNVDPTQETPVVNTTNPATNYTNTNLTAYNVSTVDIDGHIVKNIYNWYRNGTSITLLNMPFEVSNNTKAYNATDYSGFNRNGSKTVEAGVTFTATGGYDGRGAYDFGGVQSMINITGLPFTPTQNFTLVVWTNKSSLQTGFKGVAVTDPYISTDNFGIWSSTNAWYVQVFGDTADVSINSSQINYGRWTHLALVYDTAATDKVQFYINGTLASSSTTNPGLLTTRNFNIGDYSVGTGRYIGTIDEVMLFNRSLSAEQVLALYNNQTDMIVSQETNKNEKHEGWSVKITPNDGYSDGITTQSNTVTVMANIAPTQGPPILNTTNPATNATDTNLTAYNISTADASEEKVKSIFNWYRNSNPIAVVNMPFEGINDTIVNNTKDYSGLGHTGSEVNGVLWNSTGGYDGRGAYKFDGTNDRINLGNANTLRSACIDGCVVMAWVFTEGSATNQAILNRWDNAGQTNHFFFYIENDGGNANGGDPIFGIYHNSSVNSRICSFEALDHGDLPPLRNQTWYHLAGRYNLTHTTIFVNGTRLPAGTACSFANVSADAWMTSTESVLIGMARDTTPIYPFNGTIDEAWLFNRSLSDEEILALYNNQTDLIVSQETTKNEEWFVEVTPNDGKEDGNASVSNTVTILNTAPTHATPILNTTDPSTNNTDTNLTVYNQTTADIDNDLVKNIYNWKLNYAPFAAVNLPFEADGVLNGTDYGGFENNISSIVGAIYLPQGGYDGRGAYNFSPADDVVNLNTTNFPVIDTKPYTVEAWIQPENGASHPYQAIFSVNAFDPAFYVSGTTTLRIFDSANIDSSVTTTTITDGNWHHVAFVRLINTTVIFYLDGNWYGQNLHAAAFPTVTNLRIGFDTAGGEDFHGAIDEFKFYNYSLVEEQIYAHYRNKTNIIAKQQIADNQNWSVQITPHDGSAEGTTLESNNLSIENPPVIVIERPVNNSVYPSASLRLNFTVRDGTTVSSCWYSINNGANSTIDNCLNTTIFPGKGARNITVYANDTHNFVGLQIAGNVTVGALPNLTSLIVNTTNPATNNTDTNVTAFAVTSDDDADPVKVIYNWFRNGTAINVLNIPFERINGTNTSNVQDYSGYTSVSDVTENGLPVWNATGGYDGKGAYEYDGTNDYFAINDATLFDFKDFTYVVRIRPTTLTGFQTIIDVDNDKQYLGFTGSSYLLFGRCGSPSFGTVQAGVWVQLAWVVNGTNYFVYENKTLIASGTGCSASIDGSTLSIGAGNAGGVGNEFYAGAIDDVKIYNISLTADQIANLYDNKTNQIAASMTNVSMNWSVEGTPNDGYDDGAAFFSNNSVLILETGAPPANARPSAPILSSPLNNTLTTNRTPEFKWNTSTDTDGDFISYNLQIDNSLDFLTPDVNDSAIINITNGNVTYQISTELAVDTVYYWRVQANDSGGYGDFSQVQNFTVQSLLQFTLLTDSVQFGSLAAGAVENTTDGVPAPFRGENSGNIPFNVTVNGTRYFTQAAINTSNYLFKARESEVGAFNTSQSILSYTNMTSVSAAVAVALLKWQNVNDDFFIDLNITVPTDEPPGVKSSTVTFTISG